MLLHLAQQEHLSSDVGLTRIDILPALKVRRFWVQTTVAGLPRLTLSRPTDNALPVSSILAKSRPLKDGALNPSFW
jgi:hypothetical protein